MTEEFVKNILKLKEEEFEKQGIWLFKHRSYLPLIVLFIGTVLYLRTKIYPETFILEGTPYEIYYEMTALFISLIGLRLHCWVYTKKYFRKEYQEGTSGRYS